MELASEGNKSPSNTRPIQAPATAREVIGIVGPFEDDIIGRIVKTGATVPEVRQAYMWLRSDEHLQRHLSHTLAGRAAEVFEILNAAYPDFDVGYRMD